MKSLLILCSFAALLCNTASGGVVFDDSYSGFTDGNLNGQGNWSAQTPFEVSTGKVVVTSVTNRFARALRFGAFRPEIGNIVRITLSGFSITDAVGNGREDYRIGFAATPEHTGAQTPQVAASLEYDSTSLRIGGATVTNYDLGDQLTLELTFTRTGADTWSLDSSVTNITDGNAVFSGSGTPTNRTGDAGASSGLTLGQFLEADSDNKANFGMRLVGNGTGSTFNIGGTKLELLTAPAVPEPSTSLAFILTAAYGVLGARRRRIYNDR